jgi:hypothetical protein
MVSSEDQARWPKVLDSRQEVAQVDKMKTSWHEKIEIVQYVLGRHIPLAASRIE